MGVFELYALDFFHLSNPTGYFERNEPFDEIPAKRENLFQLSSTYPWLKEVLSIRITVNARLKAYVSSCPLDDEVGE